MQLNPQHTVPTLDDNGYILCDSSAIATYLIEKYAKDDSLYPKDVQIRGKINQRLFFNSSVLFVKSLPCRRAVFLEGATEFPPASVAEIQAAYDLLEVFLKDEPYLVGNTLTVADLCTVAVFSTALIVVPLEAEKRPKLNAWYERLKQLPHFDEINEQRVDIFKKLIFDKIEANKLAAANK